jgi:hypothetical protein
MLKDTLRFLLLHLRPTFGTLHRTAEIVWNREAFFLIDKLFRLNTNECTNERKFFWSIRQNDWIVSDRKQIGSSLWDFGFVLLKNRTRSTEWCFTLWKTPFSSTLMSESEKSLLSSILCCYWPWRAKQSTDRTASQNITNIWLIYEPLRSAARTFVYGWQMTIVTVIGIDWISRLLLITCLKWLQVISFSIFLTKTIMNRSLWILCGVLDKCQHSFRARSSRIIQEWQLSFCHRLYYNSLMQYKISHLEFLQHTWGIDWILPWSLNVVHRAGISQKASFVSFWWLFTFFFLVDWSQKPVQDSWRSQLILAL